MQCVRYTPAALIPNQWPMSSDCAEEKPDSREKKMKTKIKSKYLGEMQDLQPIKICKKCERRTYALNLHNLGKDI